MKRDILSRSEVENMIEVSEGVRNKVLIAALYLLGCRISELLALKRGNIVVHDDNISFNIIALKRGNTKIEYRHTVTISRQAPFMDMIIAYLGDLNDEDLLFDISRVQAWRVIKRADPTAWCHLFRHTRLTKLAEAGANPFQLQVWAGWQSVKQSDIYVRKSDKMILDLADKVD